MSQGTEIFVVKRHNVELEKLAGHDMPPHQLQRGRSNLF